MIELFTSVDDYWLASIGLSVILVGLLLGGLVILVSEILSTMVDTTCMRACI